MSDNNHHTFRGLGLEIKFPFEPYVIQKNMMNKVTKTLSDKEHSLIESPTGTGKTLALLCSSLAWQQKSKSLGRPFLSERKKKAIAAERREKLMRKPCTCGRRPNRSELDELKEAKENSKNSKKKDHDDLKGKNFDELMADYEEEEISACKKMKLDNGNVDSISTTCQTTQTATTLTSSKYFPKSGTTDTDCIIIDDDFDDDDDDIKEIEQCKAVKNEKPAKMCDSKRLSSDDDMKKFCISCAAIDAEDKFSEVFQEDSADVDTFVTAKIKSSVPRIYYGTRTHKQISQVIRELNKTPYKENLRMCILSSRERTCINPEVKDSSNRNDLCQELLKNNKSNEISMKKSKKTAGDCCHFYKDSNSNATIFEMINTEFEDKAWDIEDAASYGIKNSACPYFGTRSLQQNADITFSPYNYLLDPAIRKSLDINLSNAIVIFDEAHNIEDICRDSASFVINTKEIDDILDTIRGAASFYMQGSVIMDAYNYFRDKLLNLKSYLTQYPYTGEPERYSDYLHKKIFTKNELLNCLISLGLGPDSLSKVKENIKALRGEDEETTGEKSSGASQETSNLTFGQMQYITQLCLTLEFMYANNSKYLDDFKGVLTKSLEREFDKPKFGQRNNSTTENTVKHVWQFSLVCMNSGIAFERIHSLAWSVIVASGTLSPIESLKTELGCQFSNIFEGSHVIKPDRIFASIVSRGPSRSVDLNCSFQNSLKLDFQDEVGLVVKDVCLTTPHGVLCFFPSYDRMENLYQRWFTKGIIGEIQKAGKKLFREERRMLPEKFEKELEKYNKNARKTGAVLFAVFRGKVSEGIDFADEAARAVITIGIPYPNFKETNVGLKKDYNDVARRDRPHLMTGGDWYSSQAFRALNQALGRCIRHKDDWGAIIMIDSRLKSQQNLSCISKWLSRNLQITDDYPEMRRSLREFVNRRAADNNELMVIKGE